MAAATAEALGQACLEVTRPLQVISGWRPLTAPARVAYLRGVQAVLRATEALARCAVPSELPLVSLLEDERARGRLAELQETLREAQGVLEGFDHRQRIRRVRERAPSFAERLERARVAALAHLGRMAVRAEFLCEELEQSQGWDVVDPFAPSGIPDALLQ